MDIETLRSQHGEWTTDTLPHRQICWSDGDDWPCRVIRAIDELATPFVVWCIDQHKRGRHLVALIPPTEAHDGLRYAGYYCEDEPVAQTAGAGEPQTSPCPSCGSRLRWTRTRIGWECSCGTAVRIAGAGEQER